MIRRLLCLCLTQVRDKRKKREGSHIATPKPSSNIGNVQVRYRGVAPAERAVPLAGESVGVNWAELGATPVLLTATDPASRDARFKVSIKLFAIRAPLPSRPVHYLRCRQDKISLFPKVIQRQVHIQN